MTTQEILVLAKNAKRDIMTADTDTKNKALLYMAEELVSAKKDILKANKEDVQSQRGIISDVMIDRLELSDERIRAMAEGIEEVVALPDPVGELKESVTRENGLVINRVSVPMGVIGIIYESRPNVTSDAAALAIKSGSACVLRCGKEAHRSAEAICRALRAGLKRAGLNENAVCLIEDTTRESAKEMMEAVGYIDLLMPRGGKGLIDSCVMNAKVPCIQTGTGICHVYVDKDADVKMALNIINNAKTSRPSVCNAEEVLLVHSDIADGFLPKVKNILVDERIKNGLTPVELRLCDKACAIIEGTKAGDADFDTEFLDYILAVKVVSGVEEACNHISAHSTGHSEAVVSENKDVCDYFVKNIDSAAVYVNASTRFTDGGEFGLGCEMGISTQKLHARGPIGLKELCSYKYVISGTGQIR